MDIVPAAYLSILKLRLIQRENWYFPFRTTKTEIRNLSYIYGVKKNRRGHMSISRGFHIARRSRLNSL